MYQIAKCKFCEAPCVLSYHMIIRASVCNYLSFVLHLFSYSFNVLMFEPNCEFLATCVFITKYVFIQHNASYDHQSLVCAITCLLYQFSSSWIKYNAQVRSYDHHCVCNYMSCYNAIIRRLHADNLEIVKSSSSSINILFSDTGRILYLNFSSKHKWHE